MAIVEKITPNQVKIMRLLFKLNRATPRKEIIKFTKINPTSLQFAVKPFDNYFLNITKERIEHGYRDMISLTQAGEEIIKAFNLANVR